MNCIHEYRYIDAVFLGIKWQTANYSEEWYNQKFPKIFDKIEYFPIKTYLSIFQSIWVNKNNLNKNFYLK